MSVRADRACLGAGSWVTAPIRPRVIRLPPQPCRRSTGACQPCEHRPNETLQERSSDGPSAEPAAAQPPLVIAKAAPGAATLKMLSEGQAHGALLQLTVTAGRTAGDSSPRFIELGVSAHPWGLGMTAHANHCNGRQSVTDMKDYRCRSDGFRLGRCQARSGRAAAPAGAVNAVMRSVWPGTADGSSWGAHRSQTRRNPKRGTA
jgi:hypothetical protein